MWLAFSVCAWELRFAAVIVASVMILTTNIPQNVISGKGLVRVAPI